MVVDPTLQEKVQHLTDEHGLEIMLLALSLTTQVTESRTLPDDESVAAVSTPLVMLLSQG